MNGKSVLTAILALGIGFGAGYFYRGSASTAPEPTPGETATAEQALGRLLVYRGTGATAAREVISLVEAIAAGGEAMLPALEEAFDSGENYQYSTSGYNVDMRSGEVSVHPDRRNALIEAVYRIGSDDAVRILIDQTTTGGTWVNRVTALAYLGQFADREDVREHFMALLKQYLVTRRVDQESRAFMDAARGRLEPEALPLLVEGVGGGWADGEMVDMMGRAVASIDRQKAAEALGEILLDPSKPVPGRAGAARILAQMPEHRNATAKLVMDTGKPAIVDAFIQGLRYGRLDYVERSRLAASSEDPAVRLQYNRDRLQDMEEAFKLISALRERVNAQQAKVLKLQSYIDMFSNAIQEAREAVRVSEEQVKKQ